MLKTIRLSLFMLAAGVAAAWTPLHAQRGGTVGGGGMTVPTNTTVFAYASQTAFFEPLSFGEERVIATCGPLLFRARCEQGGGNDVVEVRADSTVDGWFRNWGGPFPAGANEWFASATWPSGTTYYMNNIDRGSLVAPTGHYLAIDGETLGLGLNIFGSDCLVAGTATCITASGF